MPELIGMLVLAVVQGLTEFLPVSSSGHLVLTQAFLSTREGDVFFDVILHLGTLGSVLVAYRHEIARLFRLDGPARRYLLALAVGTIPAVVVGLVFKDAIESLFHAPAFVAIGLLLTGALLFSTRSRPGSVGGTGADGEAVLAAPTLKQALLIGCGQALAIMPGISRSGSTIAASLWLGLPRAEAARFSFLLSVPAICGALVLQVWHDPGRTEGWGGMALAAFVAFAVGLLALRWTALAVVQAHFWKFGYYCVALAVVTLVVLR